MNIGIITPGFSADENDWAIPALQHLVTVLSNKDDVRVFATRYPHRRDKYSIGEAAVFPFGGADQTGIGSIKVWVRVLRGLIKEHRRRKFDVLHAFWANEAGMLAVIAGRLLGVPTVVSLAGGELVGFKDISYGGRLSWIERQKTSAALRGATVVTGGSDYILKIARPWTSHHPSGRVLRVPLGVNLNLFKKRVGAGSESTPRILIAASLVPIKDHETLLAAVKEIKTSGKPFVLDIVGEGRLQQKLEQLAEVLGISDIVCFHGAVNHIDMPSLLNNADIFVLSSRHEAQCMAVLEAGAIGVPIVGTTVGVIPELAPDAAIVVPVGDASGLSSAIANLLENESLRKNMGVCAARRVENEFSLQHACGQFLQIYRMVSGNSITQ